MSETNIRASHRRVLTFDRVKATAVGWLFQADEVLLNDGLGQVRGVGPVLIIKEDWLGFDGGFDVRGHEL